MLNSCLLLKTAGRIAFLTGVSISFAMALAVTQDGKKLVTTFVADEGATLRSDLAFDVVSIRPAADPDH
jgi:hypothetical protein